MRRYERLPEVKRAELLEGTVCVHPPLIYSLSHRRTLLTYLLVRYQMLHPETETVGNTTWLIDGENVAQPDSSYRVKRGGSSWLDQEGFLRGVPEMVFEVTSDIHSRKDLYQRVRAQEFVHWRVEFEAIDFYRLDSGSGVFLKEQPDADGVWRSWVFPGLALDVDALFRNDLNMAAARIS